MQAGRRTRQQIRYHRRLIPRLLQTKSDGMLDATAKKRESLINAPARKEEGGKGCCCLARLRGGGARGPHFDLTPRLGSCLPACTWSLERPSLCRKPPHPSRPPRNIATHSVILHPISTTGAKNLLVTWLAAPRIAGQQAKGRGQKATQTGGGIKACCY